MADIVDLRSRQPTSHDDEFNSELIRDLARFSENLVTEKEIRRRYRFDDAVWESLDEALIAAIEDEKTRRVRSGQLKRERSQVLITKAPDILDAIATDASASPRHRVDAIKTLDNFCANGPEGVPAADRFQITIVLDSDTTIKFDKSIKPDPNDVDPNHPDDMPMIAAITAKKTTENGGGQESL